MIDYGLIAFKRSEDSLKQNLKVKLKNNFLKSNISGQSNEKIYVCDVKTVEQTLLTLKINCGVSCDCEIYVNEKLEYALKLNNNGECAIWVNGTNKIEIKFLLSENVAVCGNVLLFGKFRKVFDCTLEFFSDNQKKYLVEHGKKTILFNATSTQNLIKEYNQNNHQEIKGYICGTTTSNGFCYLKQNGNLTTMVICNNTFNLNKTFNNAIAVFDCDSKKIIVLEIKSNQIYACALSLTGSVELEKSFYLPQGIYAKKLFAIVNNNLENVEPAFVLMDANSQMHMVICKHSFLASSSQKMLNCITLSIKGESAVGYVCEGKYYLEINLENSLLEIVVEKNFDLILKQSQTEIFNLKNKIVINNLTTILNFDGYMVEQNVT